MEKGIYIRHINAAGEEVFIRGKIKQFLFPNSGFHSVNNKKLSAPSHVGQYAASAKKTYLYMCICVVNKCVCI